jgi:glycogen debranching enzyme
VSETIKIGDKWYVAATAARTEDSPQVLKHGESFVMFDRFGDVQALSPGDQGLYHEDTRFLSQQTLMIDGARPLYLGSMPKDDNSLLIIELMNPDLRTADDETVRVAKGTLHIFRAKLLWQGACYEHIRVTNHGREPVAATLGLSFDADFADLFELRGMRRERRGERLPDVVGPDEAVLAYRGLDERERGTRLCFSPAPSRLKARLAEFDLALQPEQELHLYCTVVCESTLLTKRRPLVRYEDALTRNNDEREVAMSHACRIETSNPLVNLWLDRSVSDLAMLTTALPTGPYPYAGVPWYTTTFGRDGILTAREYLWVDPSLARGVLAFLAATQATEEEAQRDAEPGKILHEARKSEMAITGEIPFGRYYGTVDATPLFIGLAGAYYARTGDLAFIRALWPQILLALQWIDRYGDVDGDGFVEYRRRSKDGLVQQGWKDSQDSIFHADGELAEPPIALCEVQGYVYEARLAAADLAQALGDAPLAVRLREEAGKLQRRFEEAFWCEDIGCYAIALDGDKRPCRVPASNAGHALWCGIASPAHAARVTHTMLEKNFFSGWGIRTIPCRHARYNPMSYHNGSIWPHDNALVAAGMARYGHTEEAMRVLRGLFDASLYFDQHRLPELFCGFPRRVGEGPTRYPVACSPQAWAAAAVFGMLQACLGLEVRASRPEVRLTAPRLPEFIQWMQVRHLRVGEQHVDLLLQRYRNNVGIEVTDKHGDMEVLVAI